MKLVWNIVRKDLRRMWLPVALWALVLIAKYELGVKFLRGDAADLLNFDLLKTGSVVLLAVDIFVQLVLVALLVQEDLLVGTRMAWATRPIAGWRLLAAKLVGAVLIFAVLPCIVSLRWWLACGYGGAEIVRATWVTLDGQALVTLPALAIAAFTGSIPRFLAALVGTWVAGMAWAFVLTRLRAPLDFDMVGGGTRQLLAGSIVLLGFAAGLVAQFHWRRLARSVGLAGGALLAATAIAMYWPWGFDWAERDLETDDVDKLHVSVERAEVESHAWAPRQWLRVECAIHGVPDDRGLKIEAWNRWHWPDANVGVTVSRAEVEPELAVWLSMGLPREKFMGQVHRTSSVGRETVILGPTRRTNNLVSLHLTLPQFMVDRLVREPADFSSLWQIDWLQPVKVVGVPARAGEQRVAAGHSVRIASAEWRDGLLSVRVVDSSPLLEPADRRSRPGISDLFRRGERNRDSLSYRLVNLDRGEMKSVGPSITTAQIGTQQVRWFGATLESPEWMAGAELVLLRTQVERTLQYVFAPKLRVTRSEDPK